jgi:hypothetical protein
VADLADVHRVTDEIRRLRAELGRSGEFEVTVRAEPEVSSAELEALSAAGVARVVIESGAFADPASEESMYAAEKFAACHPAYLNVVTTYNSP